VLGNRCCETEQVPGSVFVDHPAQGREPLCKTLDRRVQSSAPMVSRGIEITRWARAIELVWRDARAVIADCAAQLAPQEMVKQIADHEHRSVRALFLSSGRAMVGEALVIEAHLAPESAGQPILIAARAKFRREMPREMATREWSRGPSLEVLLDAGGAFRVSPELRPSTFVSEMAVHTWPLLELVDSATIAREVTAQVRRWGMRGRPARVLHAFPAFWPRRFAPVQVGPLVIAQPPVFVPCAVVIEPGMAFGPTHWTSMMILEWLVARPSPPARVLDVGTGTGVLAIAAARLGSEVVATEIEPHALGIALENAALNDVSISFSSEEEPHRLGQRFDAVIANLPTPPLDELVPSMLDCLTAEGVAVLSGMLDVEERELVLAACEAAGATIVEHLYKEGCFGLVIRRSFRASIAR